MKNFSKTKHHHGKARREVSSCCFCDEMHANLIGHAITKDGRSHDLFNWTFEGRIDISNQKWMDKKYGAPFIWKEGNQWLMILMGHGNDDKTTFGVLTSTNGIRWILIEEEENDI